MFAVNNVNAKALLTQAMGTGGPLNGVKVALITAGPAVGPGSALADYTLATFTGSTPASVTWLGPDIAANGQGEIQAQVHFAATATPSPAEMVTGYILTDSGGTNLIGGELFTTPYNVANNGDLVTFTIRFDQSRITGGQVVEVH